MATNTSGSANRYTSRKIEVDGITLYDSDARFRKNFLKKHLKNTVDVVRFSYMMGKLAVKPVIGPLIRKGLELHYRYIHTNSVVVPIEVAKDIIRNTTDIAVSPCVCRTVRQNCDQPINTCMGLNFYGAMKKKAGERGLSKEEALAVADMAHERGADRRGGELRPALPGQPLFLLRLLLHAVDTEDPIPRPLCQLQRPVSARIRGSQMHPLSEVREGMSGRGHEL